MTAFPLCAAATYLRFELIFAVPDTPGQLACITTALGEAEVNIRDIEVLDIRERGGALRLNFNYMRPPLFRLKKF
ncbi:MAG: ACT domain-containing protein [Deinococcales bacterium]